MSESKRHAEHEENHGTTELEIAVGAVERPRTFKLRSPHRTFNAQTNSVMLILPELLSRILPEEEEAYLGLKTITRKSAAYTCTISDDIVICDASAASFNVSLPSATALGKSLIIVKGDDSANPISILPFGNDLIEGAASLSLSAQYDKAIFCSDGISTWLNLGKGEV